MCFLFTSYIHPIALCKEQPTEYKQVEETLTSAAFSYNRSEWGMSSVLFTVCGKGEDVFSASFSYIDRFVQ